MGLLIKDPLDPEKFKNVIVDKPKERELKLKAAVSKKPTHTMLNGLLELVFTRKELSTSSGLGLRRKTEKPSAGQGFNGPFGSCEGVGYQRCNSIIFIEAIIAAQNSYKIYNKGIYLLHIIYLIVQLFEYICSISK